MVSSALAAGRFIRKNGIPSTNWDLRKRRQSRSAGDDSALAQCYKYAFALVYPSLYEGFGIPPWNPWHLIVL